LTRLIAAGLTFGITEGILSPDNAEEGGEQVKRVSYVEQVPLMLCDGEGLPSLGGPRPQLYTIPPKQCLTRHGVL
jgi:hypothetical protein